MISNEIEIENMIQKYIDRDRNTQIEIEIHRWILKNTARDRNTQLEIEIHS